MTDEYVAKTVRDAVARLNEALAEAARAGLSVTLRSTSHQTTTVGVEQLAVDVRIHKLLCPHFRLNPSRYHDNRRASVSAIGFSQVTSNR